MDRDTIKAERSRNLRYKKPALSSLGFEALQSELEEIIENCDNVSYFLETDDGGNLLEEMIGNEDESWEFRMAFSDFTASAEELSRAVYENGIEPQEYDDCTVALIGNRYEMVGYDSYEEDYFGLTRYEKELAEREAGKRLMRLTKAEMLSTIGQNLGVLLAFLDLRQKYDYLKATMDIIRDENVSVLRTIKEIEAAYDRAEKAGFDRWYDKAAVEHFDRLTACLPQRVWLE